MATDVTRSCRRRGFTLIELLVVIGIIVILVGILLPVAASIRKKGFETSTTQELSRLASAINAYYNDFRAYPGPISEADVDSNTQPPSLNTVQLSGATRVTSSENLVIGLIGGLVINQANPSSTTVTTFTFDPNQVTKGPQSLNPHTIKQYLPYVDVSSDELAPTAAGGAYTQFGTSDSVIPEFVDHIPGGIIGVAGVSSSYDHGPIIYLRARVGNPNPVDGPPNSYPAGTTQYNSAQMLPYGYKFPTPNDPTNNNQPLYPTPIDFFKNPALATTPLTPRSKDSFLLISAGSDHMWGTQDDIIFSN